MAGKSAKSGPSFLNLEEGSFELGLYQQGEPLGRGAFGSVYKYERKDKTEGNETHPRYIAVKEVMMLNDKEDNRRLVRREYYNMKHSHKNIVSYLGMAIESKMAYFVMELCTADLRTFRKERILIKPEVSVIMKQVLTALDYLHKRNIIHRDVKPQNVLVKTAHDNVDLKSVHVSELTMKLCDFGFARNVHSISQAMSLSTVGTLEYVPPEARKDFENKEPTSHYSVSFDTYSAGVVTHELSMGRLEKDIKTYTNAIKLKTSLGHNNDSVLDDFLKSMLNKKKDRRKSPEELLKHPFIKLGEDYLSDYLKGVERQTETERRIEEMLVQAKSQESLLRELREQNLELTTQLESTSDDLATERANSERMQADLKLEIESLKEQLEEANRGWRTSEEEIRNLKARHDSDTRSLKQELESVKEKLNKETEPVAPTPALKRWVRQITNTGARSKNVATVQPRQQQQTQQQTETTTGALPTTSSNPSSQTKSLAAAAAPSPVRSPRPRQALSTQEKEKGLAAVAATSPVRSPSPRQALSTQEKEKVNNDLWQAANDGNVDLIKSALDSGADIEYKKREDVRIPHPNGETYTYRNPTPLILASARGHLRAVECLISHGSNVESTEDLGDMTSLMAAAFNGHQEVISVLLDNEAEINGLDNYNSTALYYASLWGFPSCVRLLLQRGADAAVKDEWRITAFSLAGGRNPSQKEAVRRVFQEFGINQ